MNGTQFVALTTRLHHNNCSEACSISKSCMLKQEFYRYTRQHSAQLDFHTQKNGIKQNI